tara:strand:- start:78 stop:440 length:363 start_codon:yes stop_codon:yes gene_type:complete
MDITCQQLDPGVILISLNGSLTVDNLNELRGRVGELLDQGSHSLIVDCTDLKFVSSAGIGAMVMLHRQVKEREASIYFAGANGPVLEVMDMMNLGSVLNLSPDTDHARRALAQTQPDASR